MKLFAPSYYHKFKCIANKCKHNCCIGWEIDVDRYTFNKYKRLKGNFAQRIHSSIKKSSDGEYCFMLVNNERCPFLNEKNLCDIILNLGEDHLCQICTDHPRFRNFFSDKTFVGLGFCCEEVSRLVMSESEKVTLSLIYDDNNGEPENVMESQRLSLVEKAFAIAQNREKPIIQRISSLLSLANTALPDISSSNWAQIYLSLEMLDASWRDLLVNISEESVNADEFFSKHELHIEQLIVYFIYRHALNTDINFSSAISFSCLSVLMIAWLSVVNEKISLEELCDVSRMYSSEIEYSDENLTKILELL